MSREQLARDLAFRRQRIENDVDLVGQCLAAIPLNGVPPPRDLAAIAWFLGAIYNEIEELLKAVAKRCGEPPINSGSWHQELLESMARSTNGRPSVLSRPLCERLGELLGFRHVSRHATALDLDWEKMRPVAETVTQTVADFLGEMAAFVRGDATNP